MLVDTQSMQVKALVGSADYFDASIDGQVNGTAAKRSPGSTLKPFIYALALDQGVLHPHSILKDAPTAFGPFSPENFDGRFVGPISAQDALVRSRNVPAVAVSAKLSRPGPLRFPEERRRRENGQRIALRPGARARRRRGDDGRTRPPLRDAGQPRRAEAAGLHGRPTSPTRRSRCDCCPRKRPSSRSTCWPPIRGPTPVRRPRAPVAWKTGTSWGFRDAWSAGVFGRYVLVVWIGNFDGSGNPAFVGVKAAAPLFFQIVDSLRSQQLDPPEPPRVPPRNLSRVEVCAASGDLPNEYCPERVSTWFLPGKSPIRPSTLHRAVFIDSRTNQAVCAPNEYTRREIHEFWPSDMLRLFREAGMPRREPPRAPDCSGTTLANETDAPQIVSPLRGVTYSVRLSKPTPVALARRAHAARRGVLVCQPGFRRPCRRRARAWRGIRRSRDDMC